MAGYTCSYKKTPIFNVNCSKKRKNVLIQAFIWNKIEIKLKKEN